MDIALGVGIFVLGVVIGILIGAAACSEGRVRVSESWTNYPDDDETETGVGRSI